MVVLTENVRVNSGKSLKEKKNKQRENQTRIERKHLLNQYFLFIIYKPTLNSLYSRMNTMYKKSMLTL